MYYIEFRPWPCRETPMKGIAAQECKLSGGWRRSKDVKKLLSHTLTTTLTTLRQVKGRFAGQIYET